MLVLVFRSLDLSLLIECYKKDLLEKIIRISVHFKLDFVDNMLHTHSAGAIDPGGLQGPLSSGILCCCHHLHGFGDLLDVLDGLQPNGDW